VRLREAFGDARVQQDEVLIGEPRLDDLPEIGARCAELAERGGQRIDHLGQRLRWCRPMHRHHGAQRIGRQPDLDAIAEVHRLLAAAAGDEQQLVPPHRCHLADLVPLRRPAAEQRGTVDVAAAECRRAGGFEIRQRRQHARKRGVLRPVLGRLPDEIADPALIVRLDDDLRHRFLERNVPRGEIVEAAIEPRDQELVELRGAQIALAERFRELSEQR
jgi:hypothetical protein